MENRKVAFVFQKDVELIELVESARKVESDE